MRVIVLAICFATPTFAWEYTPSPVCTVSHETEQAELALTYDRRSDGPYAIEITQKEKPWARSPLFVMRFDGPRPNVISTNRHSLGADDLSLTVTDRGFGNVLDGIEFNFLATAKSGETVLYFQLEGAADAMRRFRVCVASPEI
jgi:hypothetical protein